MVEIKKIGSDLSVNAPEKPARVQNESYSKEPEQRVEEIVSLTGEQGVAPSAEGYKAQLGVLKAKGNLTPEDLNHIKFLESLIAQAQNE